MREVNGEELTNYPPMHPFILSLFGSYSKEAAPMINFLSIAVSLFIWIKIAKNTLKSSLYYILFCLVLLFSTPWLLVGHFIWTEPFFILLFSLYIFLIFKYLNNLNFNLLTIATVIGIVLPLQRTAGLFVLLAVFIPLFFIYYKNRTVIISLFVHFIICVSGFIIWLIQKDIISRRIEPNITTTKPEHFLQQLSLNFKTLGSWVIPNSSLEILITFAGVFIFLFIFLSIFRDKRQILLSSIVLLYFTAFTLLPVIFSFGSIDDPDRYFSVIYAPVFLLLFIAADGRLNIRNKFILIIVITWLCYPILRTIKNAVFFHQRQEEVINNSTR